jgi:hypothetical protein
MIAAALVFSHGVRPNSPITTTSVFSSSPRVFQIRDELMNDRSKSGTSIW